MSWSSYRAMIQTRPAWQIVVTAAIVVALDLWALFGSGPPGLWLIALVGTLVVPFPLVARWWPAER